MPFTELCQHAPCYMTTGCLAGRFNPGEGGGSFQTKFFLYIIFERKEITVLYISFMGIGAILANIYTNMYQKNYDVG